MSGSMIDDSDSAVVYSGKWSSYSDWSSSYQRTTHVSGTLNDRAVLTFRGIGVLVNSGQQGVGSRVRASYSIDGGSPTTIVYSNDSSQLTSQAYRSPTLPDGQHTLTVTNLGSDFNNIYNLYLDSFLVIGADETTPASSSSNPTTLTSSTGSSTRVSSEPSSIAQSRSTGTSTANGTYFQAATARGSSSSYALSGPSSSTSPRSPTNPRNSTEIPLVVGPILGAIVICSLIFLLLRRRWKQKEPDSPVTPAAFDDPIRFPPVLQLADGQKPSSFLRDSREPPPYVQDTRPPSHLFTPNRLPAKFRSEG